MVSVWARLFMVKNKNKEQVRIQTGIFDFMDAICIKKAGLALNSALAHQF
jgi:hypothetical protein